MTRLFTTAAIDYAMQIFFIALIALTLLFLGSVDIIPFSIVSTAMFFLAFISTIYPGIQKRNAYVVQVICFIFTVILCFVLLQIYPWPITLFPHSPWRDLRDFGDFSHHFLSISPSDTWAALFRVGMPLATFLVSITLCKSDTIAVSIIKCLSVLGGMIAVFAVCQFLLYPGTLIVTEKIYYRDSLTAVFVNRNSAATFLGCVLLLLITNIMIDNKKKIRVFFGFRSNEPLSNSPRSYQWMFYSFLLSATFCALMLTKSRGGIFCTFLTLAYLLPKLLGDVYRRERTIYNDALKFSKSLRVYYYFAAVGTVALLSLLFAGRVLLRAEVLGLGDPRFCVYRSMLSNMFDNMPFGSGLGTFWLEFKQYRNPQCGIWGVWDRAHSLYLEGLSDFGIAFAVALIFSVFSLLRFFSIGKKERRQLKSYASLGTALLLLVGLHSFVDFSIQIPGFNVFLAAAFGAIVSICLAKRKDRPELRDHAGNASSKR